MSQELVDIDCKVVRETERAILIEDGSEVPAPFGSGKVARQVWLPKSLAEDNGDGTVTIPRWVAEREGLV